MFAFIIILIAIMVAGMTTAKKDEFFTDYCSPKNTATINAIFSILIFLSHAVTYTNCNGVLDGPYFDLRKFLGQLVVVTYLFFSGFGIMESIKKKGTDYVKKMPVQRLFKLWYHFAIVLIFFVIVSVGIRGLTYTPAEYLMSLVGLKSLGNSNWYMFATFLMYIIVIVSFLIFRKKKVLGVGCVVALTLAYMVLASKLDMQRVFYNTVCCFPAGMVFSLAKPYIDKILMKNDLVWFTAFAVGVLGFAFFSQNRNQRFLYYELFVLFAVAVIVMFMMKVNIKSSILDWFGQHIFSFFILQRIPMLLLKHYGFAKEPYFFIIVSFFMTIFLSVIFDAAIDKLDSIVFKPRKKKEIKA